MTEDDLHTHQLVDYEESFRLGFPLNAKCQELIDSALSLGAMSVSQVVGEDRIDLEVRLHARLNMTEMFDFLSIINALSEQDVTPPVYATDITVRVLSDSPVGDGISLDEIARAGDSGGYVLDVRRESSKALKRDEVIRACQEAGSDAAFFFGDEDEGNQRATG